MLLFQQSEGTAAQRRVFLHLVDATDGITPETGESGGQPQVSKNGASFANTSATLTAVGNGLYYVELTATELNTVGVIAVRYKTANTAEAQVLGQVVPWDPYDSVRQGMTALPNAAAEAAGGLYTRGTGAGQINQDANGRIDTHPVALANNVITAAAINAAALTAAKFGAAAIDSTVLADNAITAAKIAANAITAAKIAAAAITSSQAPNLDVAVSTRSSHSAQDVIAGATGTAEAGSDASNIVDTANRTESVADYWKHMIVLMTSGPNVGQARRITAFNAGTDTITVGPSFKSAVAAGNTYVILRTSIADALRPQTEGNEQVDVAADGDVGADVQTWLDVAVSALIAGRVDSDVGAMQANVLTAAALAADAVTEIQAAILSDATPFAGANVDAAISSRATPADVNAQVVDVLKVDTIAELGVGLPSATPTFQNAVMLLYMALRNQLDVTSSLKEIHNDAGSVIAKKSLSDDTVTYSEAKMVSGP